MSSLGATATSKFRILVCRGPECGERRGSHELRDALVALLAAFGLSERVALGWQSCFGRCTQGPNVLVQELAREPAAERQFLFATMPLGRAGRSALYNHVTLADVEEIVRGHIVSGRLVSRLIEAPARSARGYNPAGPSVTGASDAPSKPSGEGSEGDS